MHPRRSSVIGTVLMASGLSAATAWGLQAAESASKPTPAQRLQEPTPAQGREPQPATVASKPAPPNVRGGAPVSSKKKGEPSRLASVAAAPATQGETAAVTYRLRYAMKPQTKIVSEVVHLAKTNTKISDVEQMSQSRTVSRKVWTVTEVAANGEMTFVHQVDAVDMSQQVGDADEVHYNSRTDRDPPAVFQQVAETIGKPIATVTITPSGKVVDRSGEANGSNLGMGDITIPMPEQAIKIGESWETSREIRVRRPDGTPLTVKVREVYTLEKVSAGVAVIDVRSEPLTPMRQPEVEAQALQQMSNGTIRFDLDAGQLIAKELAWDKTVVGFSGPGSVMDYSARLEETVQKP